MHYYNKGTIFQVIQLYIRLTNRHLLFKYISMILFKNFWSKIFYQKYKILYH